MKTIYFPHLPPDVNGYALLFIYGADWPAQGEVARLTIYAEVGGAWEPEAQAILAGSAPSLKHHWRVSSTTGLKSQSYRVDVELLQPATITDFQLVPL